VSSPITFSGFNSIDFNTILNAVMTQERQPLDALQTQANTLQAQNSIFATLAGKLTTLGNAADSLKDAKSLSLLSATSSDSGVGVSTTSGTVPGTYAIVVSELARAQATASQSTYTATDAVVGTAGTMTLTSPSGSPFSVTLTGSTTLQQLADTINGDSTSPATASIVQSAPGQYQLVLTGNQTGAANAFTVTSAFTGGAGVAFKDTNGDGVSGDSAADNTQSAVDAALTVNGLPVTSSSNTVTDVVPGVTLSLSAKDPAKTVTVSVTRDTSAAKNVIQKFIDGYNAVVQFNTDQANNAKNGYANISRDPMLRGFKDGMRTALMDTYPAGSFSQLAAIGLGFDMSGKLTLDSDVFNAAIAKSPSDVQQLISGSTGDGGAFGAISTLIDQYTNTGGLVASARDRIDAQVAAMTNRLDSMSAALEIRRQSLQQEYIAADLAMTRLKSQSASLTSATSS
jgi:flagellar hook-associated protein 2